MSEPRNARQTSGGRVYVWRDEEEFLSVTNILSNGVPKPALQYWRGKTVAEYAADNLELMAQIKTRAERVDLMKKAPDRNSDAAAGIGTLIHDIAEARVLGLPLPEYEDKHAGFVRSFEMFLDDWQPEYEATEMTVYHRAPTVYAGTLDFIARLPGLGQTLGDYKTSRSGIFGETVLQLAAYRYAEFAGMPNGEEIPMPQVDTCVALNLRPEGYKLHVLEADENAYRTFLYAMQIAQFVREGRDLISAPLPPPKEKAPA